ncbi:hypothetical protein LTR91_001584 [Friedmanniomyces endolithicus]|uniref:Uncharacterized protein n=1 Tax=Friedmanniomyces endolithicus TaxID=329885 RepID=A0AAN6G4V0_9PEZI|nr:hypothetical protein LTR35_015858 [Friedmanniomyces endolithicus]KAK0275790.1 hypothetical protein LTS00_014937 [Friedmanniomyces endolithicus]KAK0316587.1 hypothetical protein LTR01_000336 [Friedmanniomyces endolithicus]KAK0327794.1 hypothetical protein LTR82_001311 [Friedmanniomyces endolithicus]KAK0834763.1 hypothetical protein LTR73_001053 [Friedmanniomyces endolithicus]
MAPVTFHLIITQQPKGFLSALQNLPHASRPLYVGEVNHWIHAPSTLSTAALLGSTDTVTKWQHLLIHQTSTPDSLALPTGLDEHVKEKWSITAEVSDDLLATYAAAQAKRLSNPIPPLPTCWSATNHSGLDAATAPPDLEASIALEAHPLGSNKKTDSPVVLRDWLRAFGTRHAGPVQVFNLLSYNPGRRQDFYGYLAAFAGFAGSKYGGEGAILHIGHEVGDWSSREDEGVMTVKEATESAKGYGTKDGPLVGWEDVALVWYPSIWHFAKMLDDPEYAEADRKYKVGVMRDGPLCCCTELEMEHSSLRLRTLGRVHLALLLHLGLAGTAVALGDLVKDAGHMVATAPPGGLLYAANVVSFASATMRSIRRGGGVLIVYDRGRYEWGGWSGGGARATYGR